MSSRAVADSEQQQQQSEPRRPTRQKRRRRQVCLFGTSANPPTGLGGHMGVVQALVDLQQFDEILVLPVYRHMFDMKRSQLVSYDHRVEMCRLALHELLEEERQRRRSIGGNFSSSEGGDSEGYSDGDQEITTKVSVSTAEEVCYHHLVNAQSTATEYGRKDDLVNDSPSTTSTTPKSNPQPDDVKASTTSTSTTTSNTIRVGTADLLEMLQRQEPETEFTFCLGGDTFLDLTAWKWKRSKDVLRLLDRRLVVIYRKGLTTTAATSATTVAEGGTHDGDRDRKNDAGSSYDEGESNHRRVLMERVDAVNNHHTLGRQCGEDKNNTDGNTGKRGGKVQLLDVPCLGDVSSSMARKMDDPERLKTILPTSVVQYIMDHKLYAFASPF